MAQITQSVSGRSRRITIDTNGNVVTSDRIFVHRSEKGFVCVGLGAGAELMERAEQISGVPEENQLERMSGRFGEPFLDRLDRLAKEYNPDEARVPRSSAGGGEWTSGGIVASAASAAANLFETDSASVVAGLATIASRLSVPTAFLGTLFIPTNRSPIASGTLPNNPDVSYRFDSDTGTLTLTRNDGTLLFSGHHGAGGIFRDGAGNAIGRMVDGALVLDPDALPGYASSSKPARSSAAAAVQTQADTDRNEPKLCPDPSPENISGRSERALVYQEQISGLPHGFIVTLNGVDFDGCRKTDGKMLDAKGPGYAWALKDPGSWYEWYEGVSKLQMQALNQSLAAGSRGVEWHVAEREVVPLMRALISSLGISNISVIYTPPEPRR